MLSVITPLHAPGNPFILETYRSLKAQTLQDWKWLIGENHGGRVPDVIRDDPRVRVLQLEGEGVGALKRALCDAATKYIVELDADDLLMPAALERIIEAFTRGADFVYSDFAYFKDGMKESHWSDYPFGELYGWSHYHIDHEGRDLAVMSAPEVTAHNIRFVDWAPDHVRAWNKSAYERVGGHDVTMPVGDDHDLIVRFFLEGCRFEHVPECLYLYRVHSKNTVSTRNAEIRQATTSVYNKYFCKLAEKWSTDRGLLLLDLCGGVGTPEGYMPIDKRANLGLIADLDGPWPMLDNTVGLIRANDAVEHLRDPVHTMNEAYRVLAPGGIMMIDVPSTNGLGAFCDPTHVSFWNRLSFRYYADPFFAKYIPEFTGKFQLSRPPLEWFPSDWHRKENVPYAEAHLFAVKDGPRMMGEMLW